MNKTVEGIILSGVGGLYTVKTDSDDTVSARAKGTFRREGLSPLVGDRVSLRIPEHPGDEYFIEVIYPRRNSLIRPPIANLDILFVTFAPEHPRPSTLYLDKLLSIAVYEKITPVVVITKNDVAPELAEKYAGIYRKTGIPVFICSATDGTGIDSLQSFLAAENGICAFAGASGVGKSTLMNALFPSLSLGTGSLSEKIARGRHTTRSVTLYPLREISDSRAMLYIADTPGFSMLDFIEFDFYTADDLPHCFPEFEKYLGSCRYTDCSHTKETDCAILQAVSRGEIAKERHDSYLSIYADLAGKHPWSKKNEKGQ